MTVAGAILLSAFTAAAIALIVVAQQRIAIKKKNAYDLSLSLLRPEFKDYERTVLQHAKNNNWNPVVDPKDAEQLALQQEVSRYLNQMEFLSIYIRQNVVDEDVIKAMIGDTLVKRFNDTNPLIATIRKKEDGDQEFYEHFQYMANRWEQNPKVRKRNTVRAIFCEILRV